MYRKTWSDCYRECSDKIGHQPAENSTCRPSIIISDLRDPDRHRTAAMRAVVNECQRNPGAIAKCASLHGTLTRTLCEAECRQVALPTEPR
jgi:hypothetical protein